MFTLALVCHGIYIFGEKKEKAGRLVRKICNVQQEIWTRVVAVEMMRNNQIQDIF